MTHAPLDGLLTHAILMGVAADGEPAFHCGLGLRRPAEAHRMEATAARLVAAWNALAGIPTDKLRPGIVKELWGAASMCRGVEVKNRDGTIGTYRDPAPLSALLRELGSE